LLCFLSDFFSASFIFFSPKFLLNVLGFFFLNAEQGNDAKSRDLAMFFFIFQHFSSYFWDFF